MTSYTHKIRKTAKSDEEKLPDISGVKRTYAGGVDCQVEITSRQDSEPTIEAATAATMEGYTGVITQQQAEILPQYKLNDAVVWELTTVLSVDGDTV
jgi:hypothetical protein